MDALLEVVSLDGFRFENGSGSCCSSKKPVNGCKPRNPQDSRSVLRPDFHKPESQNPSSADSPASLDSDQSDFAVLKYINDMLMEEDLEGHSSTVQDSLALQAAEKSFYEVLQNQSSPSDQNPGFFGRNNGGSDDDFPGNLNTTSGLPSRLLQPSSEFTESPESAAPAPVVYEESQRKNRCRDGDDILEDGRRNKQPAISLPDMELAEKFQEVLLLCKGHNQEATTHSPVPQSQNKIGRAKGSSNRSKTRKPEPKPVDLLTLLAQCAQAVASFDKRTAAEKLKQIRLHSSQFGDGTQRLAFYFVEALEARLVGIVAPAAYSPLPCSRTSMVDILEAYKLFVQACPFNKMSCYQANKTIKELASQVTRLHIIDFGILYGFQWPCLIQALSGRPGGPPMLRITGIEFPQPGFRPTERVEETGRRLKRFCEWFNVPFEYNFIAKKWETITLDDLEINQEETTVVNCLYRLRQTPDETVSMNSPRDMVLKLIRDINPDLFVFGEVNGMHNSPFFVTRFREALFYFSSLFDMLEATTQGKDEYRMLLERELFVRDAINVIACEGAERVERPETYKQWQVRVLRAGFRPLELNKGITKAIKEMVRTGYHRDFVIDTDNHWMLQGWKGRVLYALSCWKPTKKQQTIL